MVRSELVGRVGLELGDCGPIGGGLGDHSAADIPAAVMIFAQFGDQDRVQLRFPRCGIRTAITRRRFPVADSSSNVRV